MYAWRVKTARNPLRRMRDRLGYSQGQHRSVKTRRPPHSGPREQARRAGRPEHSRLVAEGLAAAIAGAVHRKQKEWRAEGLALNPVVDPALAVQESAR